MVRTPTLLRQTAYTTDGSVFKRARTARRQRWLFPGGSSAPPLARVTPMDRSVTAARSQRMGSRAREAAVRIKRLLVSRPATVQTDLHEKEMDANLFDCAENPMCSLPVCGCCCSRCVPSTEAKSTLPVPLSGKKKSLVHLF